MQKRFNLPPKKGVAWALLEPSKKAAISHIPNIVDKLSRMQGYEQHAQSIRDYFGLVVENKQFSPNLMHNW
jgi:hypothetical protein